MAHGLEEHENRGERANANRDVQRAADQPRLGVDFSRVQIVGGLEVILGQQRFFPQVDCLHQNPRDGQNN